MREQWTEDAQWVMEEAAKAAAVRSELLVGSGHVLLALLDSPEERLPATLRLLGVPVEELRRELLSALPPGALVLPLTSAATSRSSPARPAHGCARPQSRPA